MMSNALQNFGIISAFVISLTSTVYAIVRNYKNKKMDYALKKDVDKEFSEIKSDLKIVKKELKSDLEDIKKDVKEDIKEEKQNTSMQVRAIHKRITEIDENNKREHDIMKNDIINHFDNRMNDLQLFFTEIIKK